MTYFGQKILPSVRKLEDFEKMLKSPYEYGVLLEMHVSRLKAVYEMAHRYDKKMFLHMDLVQGLKNDEYAFDEGKRHLESTSKKGQDDATHVLTRFEFTRKELSTYGTDAT